MEDQYRVIRNLLQTEKGTVLQGLNKYLFQVDKKANKIEIKRAVEKIYQVKVRDVNTSICHGKKKKVRYVQGRTPDWKKAVVTLHKGHKIEGV